MSDKTQGALWTAIPMILVGILAYVYGFGGVDTKIKALEDRVQKLEQVERSADIVPSSRAEMCGTLVGALREGPEGNLTSIEIEAIEKQLEKFECAKLPIAS